MTTTPSGRNPNPYQGIDWEHVPQVSSCTHFHCTTENDFAAFLRQGLELAMFSNYYPSAPYYPLKKIRENTFRLGQDSYVKNNSLIMERIDFCKERETWDADCQASLPPLPKSEGERVFPDPPENFLEAPNAEHHWFSDHNVYLHICAPGSLLSTSHFDREHRFGLEKHGLQLGCKIPWREGLKQMFNSLLIPDGGGAVIAHPHWSHLPIDTLIEILDFDPRVLGFEVYNHNSGADYTESSEVEWDYILGTGRQCFGFFVQDHTIKDGRGKIILLPEERSAEACLRAMRQGRFYGAITGSGLRFEKIVFDGQSIYARCNAKASFQLTSKTGVVCDFTGEELSFILPENAREKHVFLRLTALERSFGDKLYAQPFMLI